MLDTRCGAAGGPTRWQGAIAAARHRRRRGTTRTGRQIARLYGPAGEIPRSPVFETEPRGRRGLGVRSGAGWPWRPDLAATGALAGYNLLHATGPT